MHEVAPPLPGRATPAATAAHARRFGLPPRPLGRTGLLVAPVGFGGYRVHVDEPQHRQALEEAVRAGVNLVDTSANYTDGGSERLVGAGLAGLVHAGVAPREAVVVVTKLGYMQGDSLAYGRRHGYPEVVEYQDECWHCIHPEYLADQLESSRTRLGLPTIDVLLLHNPEYFFIDRRNRRGRVDDADRDVFYDRIRRAFEFLERSVARGEIAWYGVSSNGLAYPESAADRTDLARMLQIAREVGGADHHFAVAQLPRNLHEQGAHAPGDASDPLAIAAANGVGVLTNRPLSAFIAEPPRTIRLADVAGPKDHDVDAVMLTSQTTRSLEAAWEHDLGQRIADELASDDPELHAQLHRRIYRWAHEIGEIGWARNLQHWLHLRNGVIATHMGQITNLLLGQLSGELLQEFRGWWERYSDALRRMLDEYEKGFRARAQAELDDIGGRLAPALPDEWSELPLSQRAVLALLATTPPISAVLVGMRRPAYVHDMAALAAVSPQPGGPGGLVDPARLLAAFAPR